MQFVVFGFLCCAAFLPTVCAILQVIYRRIGLNAWPVRNIVASILLGNTVCLFASRRVQIPVRITATCCQYSTSKVCQWRASNTCLWNEFQTVGAEWRNHAWRNQFSWTIGPAEAWQKVKDLEQPRVCMRRLRYMAGVVAWDLERDKSHLDARPTMQGRLEWTGARSELQCSALLYVNIWIVLIGALM